ncbi:MAG: ABC transporter substrate-binding protein [Desulfurococcales archaeon]|nr:ABC transporter substrate-binding protein [Desulfurococcales archaeon]
MGGEVGRRDFLKIAGAGVLGLIVGAGVGYSIGSRGGGGGTETVTVTQTAGGQQASQQAAGGIPGKPLKIGYMYFMTGPFGTYGDMASKALEMAAEEVNNAGGILGRKVELISKDEADRERVVDNIIKMVQDEGAEILVGIDSSGDSLKLIDTIEKELQVPLIVTHAATPKLTECAKRKYIFRVSMYEEPIDVAAAILAAENYPDAAKVANIGPDYAYGWDSWAVFSSVLKELRPDIELLDPVYTKLGTTDYASYIDEFNRQKPDILFSSLWGGDAATFFKQAVQKGLFNNIKAYINPMLGATDTLKAIGDENVPQGGADIWGSGRYWFDYPPPSVYPVNKAFVDNFKSKYGEYPAYVSGTSYTALYAIKAAVERAYAEKGSWPDPDDFVKAMEDLVVAGPMGPVYVRGGDHQGMYEVYWGKLARGGGKYPHPILSDLKVFSPFKVFPEPLKTRVEC